MDLEGFAIDEYGQVILNDECGGSFYLPSVRFQICFTNVFLDNLIDSPSGAYRYIPDRKPEPPNRQSLMLMARQGFASRSTNKSSTLL